jgi:glutathione peroxidase
MPIYNIFQCNLRTYTMTLPQTIRKKLYPLAMSFKAGRGQRINNSSNSKPLQSFYNLKAIMNNGQEFSFDDLKDKKVMIVNTASDCLFTNQYKELEELHQLYKDKLAILGFPSNDFGKQEKGSDDEIAEFCQINYHVTFPLMQKSIIVKKDEQHEVYQWLTNANKNGWNNQAPVWNFSKYLINEEGILTDFFGPAISPLSEEVKKALL